VAKQIFTSAMVWEAL